MGLTHWRLRAHVGVAHIMHCANPKTYGQGWNQATLVWSHLVYGQALNMGSCLQGLVHKQHLLKFKLASLCYHMFHGYTIKVYNQVNNIYSVDASYIKRKQSVSSKGTIDSGIN